MIKQARVYDMKKMPDQSSLGCRVLVMRKWPQGFSKHNVDVWLPDAGPSKALLDAWNECACESWEDFAYCYQQEQRTRKTCRIVRYANGKQVSDETVSRSSLDVLRGFEREFGTVTVMCWEDTDCHCHRHLLVDMLKPLAQVARENFEQEQREADAVKLGVPVQVVRK